jgi:tRNA U34 2-thiouridine synthase MnmA/TrmU
MTTIYVGMSGGVDSSVAAALLSQQGYRVVGVYMKNWTEDVAGVACPWKTDLADARAAAAVLDVPFKVFDFQAQYRQQVVDAMVAEYAAGRTPNPDVMCNQEIKFKLFLETALADGADMIATGHYARVNDGQLLAAADADKDQTYFLYYTIGQRHGLGIGGGSPYYVTAKDMATNTVTVTADPADLVLTTDSLVIDQLHWIGAEPKPNQTYQIRLRHRGALINGKIQLNNGRAAIKLDHSERAVAAGQSAVVYDGQTVMGGGIIAAG